MKKLLITFTVTMFITNVICQDINKIDSIQKVVSDVEIKIDQLKKVDKNLKYKIYKLNESNKELETKINEKTKTIEDNIAEIVLTNKKAGESFLSFKEEVESRWEKEEELFSYLKWKDSLWLIILIIVAMLLLIIDVFLMFRNKKITNKIHEEVVGNKIKFEKELSESKEILIKRVNELREKAENERQSIIDRLEREIKELRDIIDREIDNLKNRS